MTCRCDWPDECAGTGVQHCDPPCGGDLCICTCGGESECPGCDACTPNDDDGPMDLEDQLDRALAAADAEDAERTTTRSTSR